MSDSGGSPLQGLPIHERQRGHTTQKCLVWLFIDLMSTGTDELFVAAAKLDALHGQMLASMEVYGGPLVVSMVVWRCLCGRAI